MSLQFHLFPGGAPPAVTDKFIISRPDVTSPSGFSNYLMTWQDLLDAIGAVSGAAGRDGSPGLDGEDGDSYVIPGPKGDSGSQGLAGIDGVTTFVVIEGQDGEDGVIGSPGDRGLTGATGADGSPGTIGYTIPGLDGEDGEQGFPGVAGDQGVTGSQGPAGVTSIIVFPGEDGEDSYVPGPQGIQGIQGPAGGGGGGSISQVESNLGSTPTWRGKFTLTDATISAASKVVIWQAPGPYTNKGTLADEAEMDQLIAIAEAQSGQAIVRWRTATMLSFKQPLGSFGNRIIVAAPPQDDPQARLVPFILGKVKGNFKFNYMVG